MKHRIVLLFSILTIVSACTNTKSNVAEIPTHFNNVGEMIDLAKQSITEIKSADFMAIMEAGDPFILIDVRTNGEHNAGYIPGSINMPRGVLEFRIGNETIWENEGMYTPIKTDLIIIYCKKGDRGALAAQTLKSLGYTNIKSVSGGFLNWLSSYPDFIDKNEVVGGNVPAASAGGGGC